MFLLFATEPELLIKTKIEETRVARQIFSKWCKFGCK